MHSSAGYSTYHSYLQDVFTTQICSLNNRHSGIFSSMNRANIFVADHCLENLFYAQCLVESLRNRQ